MAKPGKGQRARSRRRMDLGKMPHLAENHLEFELELLPVPPTPNPPEDGFHHVGGFGQERRGFHSQLAHARVPRRAPVSPAHAEKLLGRPVHVFQANDGNDRWYLPRDARRLFIPCTCCGSLLFRLGNNYEFLNETGFMLKLCPACEKTLFGGDENGHSVKSCSDCPHVYAGKE